MIMWKFFLFYFWDVEKEDVLENRIREILSAHNPEKARCVDGYWTCPECGHDYGVFPPEAVEDEKDEFSHVSSLLVQLVIEYQAKSWDKGFGEGSSIAHWWDLNPGRSNKEHKNPYRKQLEDNGRR